MREWGHTPPTQLKSEWERKNVSEGERMWVRERVTWREGLKNRLRDEPLNFNHIFVITSHRKMIYYIYKWYRKTWSFELENGKRKLTSKESVIPLPTPHLNVILSERMIHEASKLWNFSWREKFTFFNKSWEKMKNSMFARMRDVNDRTNGLSRNPLFLSPLLSLSLSLSWFLPLFLYSSILSFSSSVLSLHFRSSTKYCVPWIFHALIHSSFLPLSHRLFLNWISEEGQKRRRGRECHFGRFTGLSPMSLRSKPREVEFEKLLERERKRYRQSEREEERKKRVKWGRTKFSEEEAFLQMKLEWKFSSFFQASSLIRGSPFSSFYFPREKQREREREKRERDEKDKKTSSSEVCAEYNFSNIFSPRSSFLFCSLTLHVS